MSFSTTYIEAYQLVFSIPPDQEMDSDSGSDDFAPPDYDEMPPPVYPQTLHPCALGPLYARLEDHTLNNGNRHHASECRRLRHFILHVLSNTYQVDPNRYVLSPADKKHYANIHKLYQSEVKARRVYNEARVRNIHTFLVEPCVTLRLRVEEVIGYMDRIFGPARRVANMSPASLVGIIERQGLNALAERLGLDWETVIPKVVGCRDERRRYFETIRLVASIFFTYLRRSGGEVYLVANCRFAGSVVNEGRPGGEAIYMLNEQGKQCKESGFVPINARMLVPGFIFKDTWCEMLCQVLGKARDSLRRG